MPCTIVRPSHESSSAISAGHDASNVPQKFMTSAWDQVVLRLSIHMSARLAPSSSSACRVSYMPSRLCEYPLNVIPANTPTDTIITTAKSRVFVRHRLRAKRLFSKVDIISPQSSLTLVTISSETILPLSIRITRVAYLIKPSS